MIVLPIGLVVLVVGLYFPIGLGSYWYGWRRADQFWKAQREDGIERGHRASYDPDRNARIEMHMSDYPGNPRR